jgi:uncharacterized protein (DUF302 family)
MSEEFAYTLESYQPFDKVVAALEKNAAKHKFRVLATHDVKQTLAEKGFERPGLKIIEVCNAAFANEALDKHSEVALFMPCRFAVYDEGDKTLVKLARPTMIAEMLPGVGLEDLAKSVEDTLEQVMKESL